MVTFKVSKRDPAQIYRGFKYRDLLTRYMGQYFDQKKELKKIERFTRYGESLYREGDLDGALEALHMAQDAAPNNPRPYNNLGVFHWLEGHHEKAVEYFATARRIDPNHRDTVWNCGQIMADSREYMMARHIYYQYMADNGYDEEMAKEIKEL
jgi:tetratricopeptide (TPR) repeat protein